MTTDRYRPPRPGWESEPVFYDPVLSLPDAERLAEQTLDAINREGAQQGMPSLPVFVADRARVASDVAGLRLHRPSSDTESLSCQWCKGGHPWPWEDAARYSEGLGRTAHLYDVP